MRMTTSDGMYAHIGETHAIADHDYDMIRELNHRLESIWRYDQFIANAEHDPKIRQYWMDVKAQDLANVKRLKHLICEHCMKGCF